MAAAAANQPRWRQENVRLGDPEPGPAHSSATLAYRGPRSRRLVPESFSSCNLAQESAAVALLLQLFPRLWGDEALLLFDEIPAAAGSRIPVIKGVFHALDSDTVRQSVPRVARCRVNGGNASEAEMSRRLQPRKLRREAAV